MGPGKGHSWHPCHQPASCTCSVPRMEQLLATLDSPGQRSLLCGSQDQTRKVLIGEVLTQVRNQALDIDAAATNCAVQTQASQAKLSCSQGTCAALSRVSKTKIPVETDQESQARIRELEGQFQLLPNLWPQPSRFGGDHLSSPDGPTESNLTFIKCPDLQVLNQGPLTRCL